jgi:hypothetical protein
MAKKIGNLSSLQFALQQIVDEPQKPDEFSAEEFLIEGMKSDRTLTITIVRNRLTQMFRNGLLTKRQIRRNGKMINLYRKA